MSAAAGLDQGGELNGRPALWHGTPGSLVYLEDVGSPYIGTSVSGVAPGEQVGNGHFLNSINSSALLWHGSAASRVVLDPPGSLSSEVRATDGVHQAGGVAYPGVPGHAAVWSGSAQSFVDLNPPGAAASGIFAMAGQQLVGGMSAPFPSQGHAALWPEMAPSAIDLHPFGSFGSSELLGTIGIAQVGGSSVPGFSLSHAGIWFGTAQSFVDLHAFLPPGYISSIATSITEANGVITVGGSAVNSALNQEAFVWVGVPAPAASMPLLLGAGVFVLRRRRRVAFDQQWQVARPVPPL